MKCDNCLHKGKLNDQVLCLNCDWNENLHEIGTYDYYEPNITPIDKRDLEEK